jgi:hypothetical protein
VDLRAFVFFVVPAQMPMKILRLDISTATMAQSTT